MSATIPSVRPDIVGAALAATFLQKPSSLKFNRQGRKVLQSLLLFVLAFLCVLGGYDFKSGSRLKLLLQKSDDAERGIA